MVRHGTKRLNQQTKYVKQNDFTHWCYEHRTETLPSIQVLDRTPDFNNLNSTLLLKIYFWNSMVT